MSLSNDTQADIIDAFNSTSKYLDDLLNIGKHFFEGMVTTIYHNELLLNKGDSTETEAVFFFFFFRFAFIIIDQLILIFSYLQTEIWTKVATKLASEDSIPN